MIKDYFLYSVRSLRNRGLRSWPTMIGIFIGIAAVVSLIGLGEGLRTAISSQFGFLGPDVLSIQASGLTFAGPPGTGVVEPLTDELADKIENINGVESAFSRYIETTAIEFNDRQSIHMVVSVPGGSNRKILETMVNLKAAEGRLLKDGDSRKVVIGSNFKKDDYFGKGVKVGDKIFIKGNSFEVIGILEPKGSFIFDDSFLMNEQAMFNILGTNKKFVDVIAVKVAGVDIVDETIENIEKRLRKERNVGKGEENFQVESPQQTLATLNQTLAAINIFVYIIASVSVAVGGIGIMNTMYTSVLERTKEIGIMKSIGARNSSIFTIFFVESGLLGMIGGIVGIILGVSFAYGLSYAGRLLLGSDLIQASISLFVILGALLFSFVLGTFFGMLPAYQASKLNPVESLRSVK